MSNIMSFIFILASIGVFFGFIRPHYSGEIGSADLTGKSVKELQAEVERYNTALEKTREIERVKDGLLAQYNSISEADRKNIIKLIPDYIDSVRLILDTNSVASRYAMAMKDISITEQEQSKSSDSIALVSQAPQYATVSLGFSVTGAYENFLLFLRDLESSMRMIDISSISFSASDTAKDSYTFKVNFKTYRLQ